MKLSRLMQVSLVVFGLACAQTGAGIVINSGTLHAEASAFNSGAFPVNDRPPDKALALPSTSHMADAIVTGDFGTSHGRAEATVGQDALGIVDIFLSTFITNGSQQNTMLHSSAVASGSLVFTQTTTQTFRETLTGTSLFGHGFVNVRDASNNFVTGLATSNHAVDSSTTTSTLSPGQYTLIWNLTSEAFLDAGGTASFHFTLAPIPEPNSLLLIFGFSSIAARHRRTRNLRFVIR
jgi:hypothetical protein